MLDGVLLWLGVVLCGLGWSYRKLEEALSLGGVLYGVGGSCRRFVVGSGVVFVYGGVSLGWKGFTVSNKTHPCVTENDNRTTERLHCLASCRWCTTCEQMRSPAPDGLPTFVRPLCLRQPD